MNATPENPRLSDYTAVIGPKNLDYYLERFQALDAGGSKAGWHWPAFLVTSIWFCYRQMWLPGLLSFFWPVILLVITGIFSALLGPLVGGLLFLLLLFAPKIVLPIFANAIYRHRAHQLIARLRPDIAASPEQREARLKRDGGTSVGAAAGLAIGAFVYVGILGAIAVPAYQDYTIRAQVTEGYLLAGAVKQRVAEYHAEHGQWPEQFDLGNSMAHGKYVQSVGVAAGSVVVRYGNQALPQISGKRLVFTPGVLADGEVVWTCGNAAPVEGAAPADGPSGTDLPNKYLPAICRGN